MIDQEFSIVLALVRCGMAHEPPTNAFVHQIRRLVEILPEADADKVRAILNWHGTGRIKSTERIVLAASAVDQAVVVTPQAAAAAGIECGDTACGGCNSGEGWCMYDSPAAPAQEPFAWHVRVLMNGVLMRENTVYEKPNLTQHEGAMRHGYVFEITELFRGPASQHPAPAQEPAKEPVDANRLEQMAKERPDDFFLKGSGVLKLIDAIRKLEREAREVSAPSGQAAELHSSIMNLPCNVPKGYEINQHLAYKIGHRDARHAAAELVVVNRENLQAPAGEPK